MTLQRDALRALLSALQLWNQNSVQYKKTQKMMSRNSAYPPAQAMP
jgi:hypothetical protein